MTSRPTRPKRTLVAVVVAVALGTSACGGGDPSSGDPSVDDPAAAAAARLDAVDPGSDTSDPAEAGEPVQLDPTSIPGEIIDQYTLRLDDCFDRLEDLRAGRPVVITTKLSCDEAHHFQVFALVTYPAEHPAIYPGDEIVVDFALRSCYQRFDGWVGTSYELSELEIGVLTPNRENFENERARYRGIHCWVEHVDSDSLVGSMRGTGI